MGKVHCAWAGPSCTHVQKLRDAAKFIVGSATPFDDVLLSGFSDDENVTITIQYAKLKELQKAIDETDWNEHQELLNADSTI